MFPCNPATALLTPHPPSPPPFILRYLHLKNHSASSSFASDEYLKSISAVSLQQRPSTGHPSSTLCLAFFVRVQCV